MDKHLLVAVSRDPGAQFGLRFLRTFFSVPSNISMTLLNILPREPKVWAEETNFEAKTRAEELRAEETARSRKALEEARSMLAGRGFDPDKITPHLMPREAGVSEDIARFAHEGLFDAVVLGKYGAAWLDGLVGSSVGLDMLDKEVDFPVWVCRGPAGERKDVLLCLDGSESSLRMADHVAFILADEKRHGVTMFHASSTKDENGPEPDEIFDRAEAYLAHEGLEAERVRRLEARTRHPARAILDESARGYAVVAAGRTGTGKGLMDKLFMGSVSHKLLAGVRDAAYWFCR